MEKVFIRIGVSAVMLLFGLDQFKDPKHWTKDYLPKFIQKLPFLGTPLFMRFHALGNFVLGLLFLSGVFEIYTIYFVLLWWLMILPFAFYDNWRTGLRDFAIVCSLIAFVFLSLEK